MGEEFFLPKPWFQNLKSKPIQTTTFDYPYPKSHFRFHAKNQRDGIPMNLLGIMVPFLKKMVTILISS